MPVLTCSRPSIAGIAVAMLLVVAASATGAAPADPALLAAANAAQPAVIASLKDMVLIESGSTDAAGLAKMAGYVEARLQALGARTERIAPARGPGSMVKGSFSGSGTEEAHADRPHGHGLPRRHARQRAVPPGRQQALRSRNRRRQGRHRRHPPFAGDPEGRRLARLRAAHGALQPRRGGRLDDVGRDDRPARRAARLRVLGRADRAPRRSPRPRACCSAPPARRPRPGGQGPIGARGRGARRRTQRAHRARLPAAADARHRPRHPGRAAELDDGAGGRGQQPDPGEGERPRRRSPDRAGRRRSAPRRLAGQGQGRPPRRRHRDDGDAAGRPAALPRQRSGACARGAGAVDLRRARRPRADAASDDRRRHRCRLRVADPARRSSSRASASRARAITRATSTSRSTRSRRACT